MQKSKVIKVTLFKKLIIVIQKEIKKNIVFNAHFIIQIRRCLKQVIHY